MLRRKSRMPWTSMPVNMSLSEPEVDRIGFDWSATPRTAGLEHLLRLADLSGEASRLVASWLGTLQYGSAGCTEAPLIGRILLMALPGFLESHEWRLEGTVRSMEERDSSVLPVATKAIPVDLGVRDAIPSEAFLFLRRSDGVSAVLAIDDGSGRSWEFTLRTTMDHPTEFFDAWHAYAVEHAYLRNKRFYAGGEFVRIDPPVRLADVYLPTETRQLVQRSILGFVRQAAGYQRRGLSAKRGVILEGPPGVGKTMLCRALCCELDTTFIWVTARHLADDGSEAVAWVWRLARMLRPTVILMEDIDLFAESRERFTYGGILGEMMNQMDGVEDNDGILTIATTNRLEVIEKALRNRPGRFDRDIHFGPPNEAGREHLLRQHLAHDSLDDELMARLVEETEGFTGAQIVDLVKTMVDFAAEIGEPGEAAISREVAEQALAECSGLCRHKSRIGFVANEDDE